MDMDERDGVESEFSGSRNAEESEELEDEESDAFSDGTEDQDGERSY